MKHPHGKTEVRMCLALLNYRHVWRWKDLIRNAQHGLASYIKCNILTGKPGVRMCLAFTDNSYMGKYLLMITLLS